MNESNNGLVADIERLVRSEQASHLASEVPFAIIPKDYKLEDLEKLQAAPRRIRENVRLRTVDSFIDYMQRWKKANVTTIFCDENARSLNAVIDSHVTDEQPTWGDHKVNYTAQLSRELQFWQKRNDSDLSQEDFAMLLEERLLDVQTPPGAQLLELALNLSTTTDVSFRSAIRLASGKVSLQYSEESRQGSVEMPEKITLGIPLFHNGDSYKVEARLRFKVREARAIFRYKLVDIDDKLEHAFGEIVQRVTREVPEVHIYQGAR